MTKYLLVLICLLASCSLPDVKVAYTAVVIDNYTNKVVAGLPVSFIKVAPSYMQKDRIINSTKTNASGIFQFTERIVGDKIYKVVINPNLECNDLDTMLPKYQYLTAGKASQKGADWNAANDTLYVAPAGNIRFSYNDSILNKFNADALIVEAGNNRAVMGTSVAFPPVFNSHPITGSVDYNLMHLSPQKMYVFNFYTHTNGVVTLRATKNIFIKNAYSKGAAACVSDQEEIIAF
jgi:hypothetical protein